METFAYRYSLKKGKSSKSPPKKSVPPKPYQPATVYANEYDDSPTENMIDSSRKKIGHIYKGKLDKLEKNLMMLEQMTNHSDNSDNSEKIRELRKEIKRIKNLIGGGKSRRKRTYKSRKSHKSRKTYKSRKALH